MRPLPPPAHAVRCIVALVWLCSVAQAQATRASPLQVRLWAASCMACHGAEGKAEGTSLRLHGGLSDRPSAAESLHAMAWASNILQDSLG